MDWVAAVDWIHFFLFGDAAGYAQAMPFGLIPALIAGGSALASSLAGSKQASQDREVALKRLGLDEKALNAALAAKQRGRNILETTQATRPDFTSLTLSSPNAFARAADRSTLPSFGGRQRQSPFSAVDVNRILERKRAAEDLVKGRDVGFENDTRIDQIGGGRDRVRRVRREF